MTTPTPAARTLECPSCDSPMPSMHPATQADGGEVLYVCPDPWHDGDPVTERARTLLGADVTFTFPHGTKVTVDRHGNVVPDDVTIDVQGASEAVAAMRSSLLAAKETDPR